MLAIFAAVGWRGDLARRAGVKDGGGARMREAREGQ